MVLRNSEKRKLIDKQGFVWWKERLQGIFRSLITSQKVENLSLRYAMWTRESENSSKYGLTEKGTNLLKHLLGFHHLDLALVFHFCFPN